VPYLSWLAIVILTVISLVLYFIPLRQFNAYMQLTVV
jgi:hypothetical protein